MANSEGSSVSASGNSRPTPALSKRWCFTVNNYDDDDEFLIKAMPTVFLIYGKEVGESGTPHLQGFCTFSNPQRLSAMKKRHPSCHWEMARGTSAQNIKYCSKDGTVFERGVRPADALRTGNAKGGAAQLQRFADALSAARRGDFDAIPADLYTRYRHTWHMEAKEHVPMPQDLDHMPGIWIHGDAGFGKSRLARYLWPLAYKKLQNKWWDGYKSEPAVILDDFDFKDLAHHLKIWADRYSFTAEIKGGALNIRPDRFIITSNYSTTELFGHDLRLLDAINRRFTVVHLTTKWSPGQCVPIPLIPFVPPPTVITDPLPSSPLVPIVDPCPVDFHVTHSLSPSSRSSSPDFRAHLAPPDIPLSDSDSDLSYAAANTPQPKRPRVGTPSSYRSFSPLPLAH